MKHYKNGTPVQCIWIDSYGLQSRWSNINDIDSVKAHDMIISTLGHVVKQTKQALSLAQSYKPKTDNVGCSVMGVITIPICAIKKIKVIKK